MTIASRVRNRMAGAVDHAADRTRRWLARRALARHARSLVPSPVATREEYLRLWDQARSGRHAAVDGYEAASGAAVEQEWFQDLALLTQVTKKSSAICYQHGRLLYSALSRYVRRHPGEAVNIVETGTARGFSALCMARALSDAGASGKIFTFDVLPHETAMYWNCIRDTEGPSTRAELLQPHADLLARYIVFHQGESDALLEAIAFPRVHFAFLDSVHTYDHVMREFSSLKPRQQAGDILFFDDYTPSYPGVMRAADEICRAGAYAATVVRSSDERAYLIAEKQ